MTAIFDSKKLRHPPPPAEFFRAARQDRPILNTGNPVLDKLTGGLQLASIIEISGQRSSGRTAILFSILRSFLVRGRVGAYIDATNSFDPRSAAEAGLAIERILWVKAGEDLKKAFFSADVVLQAGGFSPVILDLADIALADLEKIPYSYWLRFQRTIEKQPSLLLVMSKLPLTKTCASLVIYCHSPQPVWTTADGIYPVLGSIRSIVRVNRPAPTRFAEVLLKSYFGAAPCTR